MDTNSYIMVIIIQVTINHENDMIIGSCMINYAIDSNANEYKNLDK